MSYAEFSPNSDAHGALAWLVAEPVAAAALPPPLPPRIVMPPPLPPMPSRFYLLRHWRGESSLAVAWWVAGVLGSIVCAFAAALLLFTFAEWLVEEMIRAFWALVAVFIALALVTVWQSVGIWRSATRYRARGKRFWGGLAKCMVVLVVGQAAWFSATAAAPGLTNLYEIGRGDPEIGPHAFSETEDGKTLVFEGGITLGVADELEQRLAAMDHVEAVQLESNGGRIREAERMAHVIKARGLSTVVTVKCLSACPTVLLGGRERYLVRDARIGFHQPTRVGLTAGARAELLAEEEARLVRLGLTPEFARRTNQARPEEMWYPDRDELLREHVVTEILGTKPVKPAEEPAEPKPVKPRGLLHADAGE
jgi:hypothetical protein